MPSSQPPRKKQTPRSAPARNTSTSRKTGSAGGANRKTSGPSGTAKKPRTTGNRPAAKANSARGSANSGKRKLASKPGNTQQKNQPNFLVRRLLVVVGALAIIGGVGWGVYTGITWAIEQFADRTAPAPTVEPTGPSVDELSNPVQCVFDALELDVTFPETVAAGSTANLGLTITNAGEVSCLTDTGYAENLIQIYSGNDLIWDRAHCGHGTQTREILLSPGASDSFTITWPGKRSDEGCPGGLPEVEPGTYRVEVTASTSDVVEPVKHVFVVSAAE